MSELAWLKTIYFYFRPSACAAVKFRGNHKSKSLSRSWACFFTRRFLILAFTLISTLIFLFISTSFSEMTSASPDKTFFDKTSSKKTLSTLPACASLPFPALPSPTLPSPSLSSSALPSPSISSPEDDTQKPIRVTRLRFWLLEALLKPESAAAIASATAPTTSAASATTATSSTSTTPATISNSSAGLRVFYTGTFPVSEFDQLRSEIQNKFSVDYTKVLKQGTYLLTWSNNTPNKEENQNKKGENQKFPLPPGPEIPGLRGYFLYGTEASDVPQTGFFTTDGRKHWISLINPDPSKPPALQLQLNIHTTNSFTPWQATSIDTKKPELLEFSSLLDFPEDGFLVVGLMAADNTAYFCCFHPDVVGKEAFISPPKLIHRAEPIYPEAARKINAQGVVILECKTDLNGAVSQIKVLEAPHPLLAAAAVQAVKQWVYKALEIEGEKLSQTFWVTVTFKLDKWPSGYIIRK